MKSMIALRECGIQLRDEVQATGVRISSKRGPRRQEPRSAAASSWPPAGPPNATAAGMFRSAGLLHLMWLFGLSDGAAMRCVTAAHPEHTAGLSR